MQGMKGDTETLTALFAVLVFSMAIAGIALLAQSYFVNFSGIVVGSEKDLLAVDASHLVDECLKDRGLYIRKDNLDAWKGKDVCRIKACGLCGAGIGAKIRNLETGEEWDFGYDEKGESKHFVYTNIEDGDKIYMGRLYVSVE